jgi:hypothetical protein
VQSTRSWIGGRPYLDDETVDAQRKAMPRSQLYLARRSIHPTLVRDPEAEMVDALRTFLRELQPVT